MRQYHDLLRHILDHGVERPDRTGTGTIAVFGHQARYNLSNADGSLGTPGRNAPPDLGFPVLTTKKLHLRSIIHELLWFLRGDTNNHTLNEVGVSIWDEWADPQTGDLGPIYGRQWRSWPTPAGGSIDQIARLEQGLRDNPSGRRHIVTAWNPGQLDEMALPPCHCLFQFFVAPPAAAQSGPGGTGQRDERPVLSCQLYQRSADVFLGVPFNIASYALLTLMLAKSLGYRPGDFIHTLGDAHLYMNHLDQARLQLEREPRPQPVMRVAAKPSVLRYAFEDFELVGYDPHPAIRAPVAV